MLARKKIESVLRELIGDEITDEMLDRIGVINTALNERDNELLKYGDFDGDDEEVTFRGREILEPSDVNWEAKYNALHQRYLDRFFGGDAVSEGDATVEFNTTETVDPEDSDLNIEIEDLLRKGDSYA